MQTNEIPYEININEIPIEININEIQLTIPTNQECIQTVHVDYKLEEDANRLLSLFNELIESEECSRLKYHCLIEPVRNIIKNKIALEKMCQLNPSGFSEVFRMHFIERKNTFVLFNDPYESMCAELLMIKYH